MSLFKFTVSEVRHYRCTYTVEAETLEEAMAKAEQGDTCAEAEIKLVGVLQREVEN